MGIANRMSTELGFFYPISWHMVNYHFIVFSGSSFYYNHLALIQRFGQTRANLRNTGERLSASSELLLVLGSRHLFRRLFGPFIVETGFQGALSQGATEAKWSWTSIRQYFNAMGFLSWHVLLCFLKKQSHSLPIDVQNNFRLLVFNKYHPHTNKMFQHLTRSKYITRG